MPGDSEKFVKTGALLGFAAFCMGPFYSKLGITASFAIKCAGLVVLNEYGKRQPVPAVVNNIHHFFNVDAGRIFSNIVNGGSAAVDAIVPPPKGGWR